MIFFHLYVCRSEQAHFFLLSFVHIQCLLVLCDYIYRLLQMPPKRANIGRRSRQTQNQRRSRSNETEEQRQHRNELARGRASRSRSDPERRQQHNVDERTRAQRTRNERFRRNETVDQRITRRANEVVLERAAFQYDHAIDYRLNKNVDIGKMDLICQHCQARKFKTETPGMCCASGKVRLPPLNPPPEPLLSMLSGETTQSKHFLEKIRTYNSAFQMTSFGATNIVNDNFMPTFKVISSDGLSHVVVNDNTFCDTSSSSFQIQGQIYHQVGSLLPLPDASHQFLQIYFVGNSNDEIDLRCTIAQNLRREVIGQLRELFHEHNQLVRLFRTALDRMVSDNHKVVIRPDKTPSGEHARRFNAPALDEDAIVIVGEQFNKRDIVLHRRNNNLQRVSETHRSYDAIQYPILFCRGEDGYHLNIKMIHPVSGMETEKKVSAMNFYSYRLMIRQNEDNNILKCRRLFNQYVVDMYAKIETERLNFIRFNQKKLRSEEYIHLRDAVNNDGDVNDIGKVVILPATYTGSPRHMHEYAQDAICYVRNYGRPDLFITFTCNSQWTEIKENLYPGQSAVDRHDITARIFKQKLKSLIDFIVKHKSFGEVRCWMYSVEWQKRGLPHAHILIWLIRKITSDEIDSIISAEIPDKDVDPMLFDVIKKCMIHGPCGTLNTNSVCMVDGRCSKRYPRALVSDTITGNDGYPLYRRRSTEDGGKTTIVKVRNEDIVVDNRWIVPYSPLLSKTFQAHINVEYCNSVKSIKYICKYVNKGSDMAVFSVVQNENDEITRYQMGRYISSNEAIWRILSFNIHERSPAVVHLSVHLENGQRVYFTSANALQQAERPPTTTLTAFFSLCQTDKFAKTLLYSEVPRYYTWNPSSKKWQLRKQGKPVPGHPNIFSTDVLGRVYTVHPSNDECFYLRLLLVNVHGPTSFQNLRTVDNQLCRTYRQACEKLNLLENDTHWEVTLADASATSSPHQIRTLFAIIIATCFPSNSMELWMKFKDYMTEDILNRMRQITANQDMLITLEMENEALILIEDHCLSIANKALVQLGMEAPNRASLDLLNQEVQRELQYDCVELGTYVTVNVPKLNAEQKVAYDTILEAIANESGGLYFLDAPGGTGKTFLISLILATVRSENKIALALASSGIAATLLEGGRTAHSAFKLPLNIQHNETPTCNISKTSGMAKVLKNCQIIIWDECTMAHKKSLEALDATLQDIRGKRELLGGALVMLSGDFRQTLPVIPRSTPADELNACLKQSYLWKHVKSLKLTINVRVQLQNDPSAAQFAKQLLDIGNGSLPIDFETKFITFPTDFCTFTQSKDELKHRVFPNIAQEYRNRIWLSERAIMAAKNKDVDDINAQIMEDIPGQIVTYNSVDTIMNQDDIVNYPVEFLNSLDLPGVPQHRLQLKIGVPIMMLRNIHQPRLCNGTRLVVKKLLNNVIEAMIMTGKYSGEDVLIPRIPIIPSDLPFEFKRLQFPVRLAFAITINKAQGQTLSVCGIDLETPCFSHGQLYVSCSRVGKPSVIFVYTTTEGKTKNVVYPKALE